jgi:hypothetical protein
MIQQDFRNQRWSRAQVFHWHVRLKTGRTSVDGDEHTARPTSCAIPETVARILELVRQDRRRTIHVIAEKVGVGYGTCQRVLTEEFGMNRDETFLSRVITGNESWVYIRRDRQTLIVALRDIAKTSSEWQYYRSLGKAHRLKKM